MTKPHTKEYIEKLIEKNGWNPRFPKNTDNLYNPSYEPFLRVIYRYDFLRISDIKLLLSYQNARNVRWYLSALKELGYINVVQFNRAFYYFITKRGAEILHSIDDSVPKNVNRTPAGMTVLAAHNSAATNVMMSFVEHDEVPDRGLLLWRGPIECENLYPYADGQPKIIPDALGYYRHDSGESSFNMELDSGKQSQSIIEEKIRNYYTYFHLNDFDPEEQIIMFVTLMGPQRVMNIINTANLYLKDVNKKMRVLVTTIKDIESKGPYEDIWFCNLTNGKKQHGLSELAVFQSRPFKVGHFIGHEEVVDNRRDLLRTVRADIEVVNGRLIMY